MTAAARRGFRPRPLAAVLTSAAVALFASLGVWQLDRAEQKRELRQAFAGRGGGLELRLSGEEIDAEMVRFAAVTARGRYDTRHQFFLANRVQGRQVGFEVLTPLEVEGGGTRVLVNRGWVPQAADSPLPPAIDTPQGSVEISGRAVVPEPNVFARAFQPEAGAGPHDVRSVLDMRELQQAVPFPLQPFVVQLDPGADAGGFVREWPQLDSHPDLMPERNISYAVQWFAMAAAVVVIFVVTGLRRRSAQPSPGTQDD